MRQLQTQEIQTVSGAGLITGVLKTGVSVGSTLGQGLFSMGKAVVSSGGMIIKPIVRTLI